MKKILVFCLMVLSTMTVFAQTASKVEDLKQKQKVLALTAKLNKMQLDYAKEQARFADISNYQQFSKHHDNRL